MEILIIQASDLTKVAKEIEKIDPSLYDLLLVLKTDLPYINWTDRTHGECFPLTHPLNELT